MTEAASTEPITIRTDRQIVAELDALAGAMERSRNFVVNQALRQYLEANAWQIDRIQAGIAAARTGRVQAAEEVFERLAVKRGQTKMPR